MMRLGSLRSAAAGAGATLARFPMALLSGFVACGTMLHLIDMDESSNQSSLRLLAVAGMGLALFTAARTGAERRGARAASLWLGYAVLGAGLAMLYLVSVGWTDQMAGLRLTQLLVLAHLAVAVAPYLAVERPNGFWQYNRFLLLRYLEASFYTLVLFAGLAIALGALDKLFGVSVPGKDYFRLLAVLAFVFHPWFFLAGVPADYEALDGREDYPLILKVFSQFVLIPLVTVYLVILTAYLGKVVFTRTWPSGWIGYLVSVVSTIGVLALLLVYPIRRRGDTPWVNAFTRWWFVALLPSLVMLLLAVGKRIGQYGVTEERYFLGVLTVWMLGISIYFGLTGSTRIKRIPETLLAVVLLSALGPWGAYAVSERSQVSRLGRLLQANDRGQPGKITTHAGAVSEQDRAQISAVFRYLAQIHGPGSVARVLGVPEDSVQGRAGRDGTGDGAAREAMRRLGLEYVDQWNAGVDGRSFFARAEGLASVPVAGFEVVRRISFPSTALIGNQTDTLEIGRDSVSGGILVKHDRVPILTLDLVAPVRAALKPDSSGGRAPLILIAPVVVEGEASGYRVRVALTSVNGEFRAGVLRVHSAEGMVMAAGFRRLLAP